MKRLHIKNLLSCLPEIKKRAKHKITIKSILPVGIVVLSQFIRLNSVRNIMLMIALQYVAGKITPDKRFKLF